jgi:oligopeptidase A
MGLVLGNARYYAERQVTKGGCVVVFIEINNNKENMMKFTNFNGMMLPLWESFTMSGFLEELNTMHQEGIALADAIALLPEPTFADLVNKFEALDLKRNLHIRFLGHMKSVDLDSFPGISKLEEECLAREIAYSTNLYFHQGFYRAHIFVREHAYGQLNAEQRYILDESIKAFELNGVALPKEQQDRLRTIYEEIERLQSLFETNVVEATDGWSLHVTDKEKLVGIPEDVIRSAAQFAESKELPGYLISQKTNVVLTVLDYAENRELREELWRAFSARASEISPLGAEFDNGPVMVKLLELRAEAAGILGLPSHAAKSIRTKMSGVVGVDGVSDFLATLAKASLPKSEEDRTMLKAFAKSELGLDEMLPWDTGFVARAYKDKFLAVNDEEVRDYLPARKVMEALFGLLQRFYGCTFRKAEVSVWHPSVQFYEVCDKNGKVFAGFYVDLLARPGKRGGAWMNDLGWHVSHDGINELPIGFLCCNFRTPSDGGEPYLLHDDVDTTFHETGHVFHHLLSKSNYFKTAMMHVEWDAIELPSQLMQHWAWDKSMLRTMSQHKETGKPLPDSLIDAMLRAKHYLAGLGYGRQFGLALFDWNLHKEKPVDLDGIMATYRNAMSIATSVPVHESGRGPHNFTHAFGGGYDAGYFSYSWANSLVADVANAFDEAGEEGQVEVAARYRDEILAWAARRPMIESFRAFRGRNPDPKYLIPYIGLS